MEARGRADTQPGPAEDRDAFRRAIEEDSEAFAAAQHFTAGLTVRTLLRLHGVDHVALGARDPDDVWVEILRDAVADDAEGEGEP